MIVSFVSEIEALLDLGSTLALLKDYRRLAELKARILWWSWLIYGELSKEGKKGDGGSDQLDIADRPNPLGLLISSSELIESVDEVQEAT